MPAPRDSELGVPLEMSGAAMVLHFPWQAKVRSGGKRETMYAILTFDDVESVMSVLRAQRLRWPDPNLDWSDRKHMRIRPDIYKHGCQ